MKEQEKTDIEDAEEALKLEIAAAEKLGWQDFLLAGLIAVGICLLQMKWAYPGIHPASWNAAAIAAGVRPAESMVPGFWQHITGWVFSAVGLREGAAMLRLLGHVTLAVITMFVYFFQREVLTFVMRARPQRSRRRNLVMRIASAIGAVAFASADPVWSAGQFFSETTLLLAMSVGAIEFFFAFLRKGQLKYSYICAILVGLLTAETAMGALLAAVFIAINFLVINKFPNLESPFFKPGLIEVGKWHMTFFFLASLIGGIAFNCIGYVSHDGLVPGSLSMGDLPLRYLTDYCARCTVAADLAGWILLIGFALGPFIVSMVRFSVAADEENFLSYSTGIVFLCCGVVALSQCASIPALWFWNRETVSVNSTYILSLCSLMCALTVACSVTILGVDSLCRDHQKLAKKFAGLSEDEEEKELEETVMKPGLTEALRKFGIVVVPLALLAAVLPARAKRATRAMLELVNDTIAATVDEAADSDYIFTDGNLDAAIEFESRARGGDLKCVALIGGGKNAVWLRSRGLEDDEDKLSFNFDGAMGLRSWIRDKPERLEKVAVQIGFDLWKRDGKPIPPIGGLLSRPASKDEAAREAGRAKSDELSKRAIAIADAGIGDCTEEAVRDAFFNTEWRLARMAFYRAESNDLAGKAKEAIADMATAQALEDRNEKFQKLRREIEKRNEQMLRRLTPREGLQLALVRADFTLGKVYAEPILDADYENPDANFAMGMYYQQKHQLSRAEEYLKRCLIRRPEEPAFYNNLAMVQLELGKLEPAEINARKALSLVPNSDAVKETLRDVLDRKAGKTKDKDKDNEQ
ncbi:MAG: hypothetical protein J6P13_01925 [Kiritimatiellae bacterium]|nr:hypothetical protein [Kiritimatiellia bacterium]